MSYNQPPAYQPPSQPSQPEYNAGGEPPIWAPWYGISLPNAVRRVFKKYADFSGRASRSEYWWWALTYGIIYLVIEIVSGVIVGTSATMSANNGSSTASKGPAIVALILSIVLLIFALAVLVPTLAVAVRRLHDANFAWGFIFFAFIPIVLLILTILPSNPQGQRFDRPRA